MRLFTTILFFLFISLLKGSAQAKLFYGPEIDRGYGNGSSIYTPYVRFSPSRLHPYNGAKITKVRMGLNSPAHNVTIYFRNHLSDRRPLYSQKIGNMDAGWNEVTLTCPFEITDADTLYIGYKAGFEGRNGVGLSQLYHPDGAIVYNNSESQWDSADGSVCIQAIIEGENLPKNELAAGWIPDATINEGEKSATFHGYLFNGGTETVRSYAIQYWIEGQKPSTAVFEDRNVVETDSFALEVAAPTPGTYNLIAVISKVNGINDECKDNDTLRAKLYVRSASFVKRVVCEEYSGLWCGWCPRGLVGLETLKAAHPNTFIAISIHGKDDLEIQGTPNYSTFISRQGGAPSCEINRDGSMDPNAESLETAYTYYSNETTHVGVNVSAAFNEDTSAVTATAYVTSDIDLDNPDYRICLVITEDSITGYAQANYYSGSLTPMGGFEDKSNPTTDVVFNDIARAINNFGGNSLDISHMDNSVSYPYSETMTLPSQIQDKRNLNVVALVLDGNKIANAATTKPTGETPNDIATINTVENGIFPVFSLAGTIVAHTMMSKGRIYLPESLSPGIYIVNGKKVQK